VSLRALELRGHPGREGDCENAGPVIRRVVEIESRALSGGGKVGENAFVQSRDSCKVIVLAPVR